MHPARATQRPVPGKPTWAERAGAWLALVTLAATIVALLAGAVLNWAGGLLAVAGVVIGVTAGWYAVSRRGAVRAIALAFAAVAVAMFVWGLLAADFRLLNVLLTVALALTSVSSARVALHRTRTAQHTSRHVHAVPPARHPVLIMNLKSGGGKASRFRLEDECPARGIEPVVLRPGDDLLQLAEDAIARGADVIGMAGGDGSQALVATVAARHQIPHVVVPAGTRNHFALDLGLDRDDVVGALDAFGDAVERRIDLAAVNGRVFVNNASLGLYAKIVQAPEYRDAKLKTAADMLPGLLGPDATPFDLRFTGPDGTGYPTAHLILVSNDPYQLDHIGGRGTRPRLDTGELGVVAARITGPAQAHQFVALEAAGQIRRFEGWLEWNPARFEVGSGGPVQVGIDGEALVMDPPLVFTSLPGALRVRVPRHASLSPAATAVHLVSRSTVGELATIAVGRSSGASQPPGRSASD
jgi:diacylglycerol kinase family enzyme